MNFGRNASTTKRPPMHTPTLRAATPVISVTETLDEYVVLGTVAAARRPHDDGRGKHDARDGEHGELESQSEGQRQGRPLIRFVANVPHGSGG